MLKAVHLDENEHKYLIDFILSYKDKNDKNNISSAIRFLMIKGYQSLYQNDEHIEKTVQEKINKNNDNIEKSLNNMIEQLYTRINTDINNKFNMQLLENNSQLMTALINIANKSNTPQIITQPYMMPAANMQMPIQNNIPPIYNDFSSTQNDSCNNNFNSNLNSNNEINIKVPDNNTIKENNDNIINLKNESKSLSTNSLLSNLLNNANR